MCVSCARGVRGLCDFRVRDLSCCREFHVEPFVSALTHDLPRGSLDVRFAPTYRGRTDLVSMVERIPH